jgi:hypothetical protein
MRQAEKADVKKALQFILRGIRPSPEYLLLLLHSSMLEEVDEAFEEVEVEGSENTLYVPHETALEVKRGNELKRQRSGHPILEVGDNCPGYWGPDTDWDPVGEEWDLEGFSTAFLDPSFHDMQYPAIPLLDGWLAVPAHKGQVLFAVTDFATKTLNETPTETGN